MTIHRFCDKDFVIDISWLAPVIGPAAGRERRKTRELGSLKTNPVGYAEIETPVGYQLGAITEADEVGRPSAAAMLAKAQESVVLIERLDSNLYWLCTIEDGAIFPAGDLVGSKDLIAERLKEIRSDIVGKNIPHYEKSGEFNIDGAQPYSFEELIEDFEDDTDRICKPFKSRKVNQRAIGVAAAVLIVGFMVGGWQYLDHLAEKDNRQLMRQQASQQSLEQEKLVLQQSLSQNAALLLATFADQVFGRPLRAAGWRIHSYEWQNDVISVTWHRDHGSLSDITAYLGTKEFDYVENSTILTESIPFPAIERSDINDIDKRLGHSLDRLQLLDKLATLPGNWQLQAAQPIGKQFAATRSPISGNSNQLLEMIATAIRIKELPLNLSRIKVTLTDSFNWELEGDYFAYSD